ncbi:MAG: endonuclease/exonuclease/phosphatase family protein [Limnobacter sp.]|nr:endonuclease/exonuclease/phosphatase family protein [Limnobacter sp.]
MKLKVITYNIHKGVVGVRRPQLTIYELRKHLHMLQPDLVFLQEVQGQHELNRSRHPNWPSQSQHEFLAGRDDEIEKLLGHASKQYFSVYGLNAVYPHGHHGNALMSVYPVLWRMNEDVSDHRLEQRGLLHCQLNTPKGKLHCIVAHFGLWGRSRKRQADRLIQHVRNHVPDDAPLIVAGDFNDWRRSLDHLLAEGLNATEVLPNHGSKKRAFSSFPSRLPFLGLDRVFVRGLEIEGASIQAGAPWKSLSDHAPLVADLQWP